MGVTKIPAGIPQSTIGSTSGSVPVNLVPATPVSATAAADTAVTLTITHALLQSTRINSLSAGYSGAVGTGLLTVVVNAVTILQCEINAQGTVTIPLPDGGIECANNMDAVITLAAGAVSAVGFINASYFMGA